MFTTLMIDSSKQGYGYDEPATTAAFAMFDKLAGFAGVLIKAAKVLASGLAARSVRLRREGEGDDGDDDCHGRRPDDHQQHAPRSRGGLGNARPRLPGARRAGRVRAAAMGVSAEAGRLEAVLTRINERVSAALFATAKA